MLISPPPLSYQYDFRGNLPPLSRTAISWKLASNKLVELYNAYLLALDVMRETSKTFDAFLPYPALMYHCVNSSYVARLVRDQPAVAKDIVLRIWKSMLTWTESDYVRSLSLSQRLILRVGVSRPSRRVSSLIPTPLPYLSSFTQVKGGPGKRAIITQQIEIFSALVLNFGDPFPFPLIPSQTSSEANYRPFLTSILKWDEKDLKSDPNDHDKIWNQ